MILLESIIFGVITYLMTAARCEVTEVFAEVNSQAVLPCKCRNDPCHPADIIWNKHNQGTVWRKQSSGLQYVGSSWLQKDGPRVQCQHSHFQSGDYSLQINSVKAEDAGLYSCRIRLGTHAFQNHDVMLRIIKVSTSPPAPLSGDDVLINCSVTPWPTNALVQWKLNNNSFVSQNGVGMVVKEKATEGMTGKWTCVISYNSNVWHASTTLSVNGIIQPAKDDTKMYAAVGSTLTLPCVFSPGLFPLGIVWTKLNKSNHNLDSRHPPSSTWIKSIKINVVLFEDQGKYRCTGTVKGQTLARTMQLVVAKVVQSKKENSVMLTCQLSDASEVTEYEWIRVTVDINGTETFGPVLKGQTVVLKENSGDWTCRYYGKNGILGNVTYQVPLMSGQSGQKSSHVSSNVGTVIGLSFLLAILLLILAQMYKNHRRRQRILQYPALETIVHTISNEREERERNRVKK
ncbi:lymphocyte activation gene 3 protein-like isoform X1 [Melanotaenia boesemani]|uniref:lymphocyte activation gene 3 protein-like isoform X1 n=1 Tax=Melanotaenia boesemani TaxID=1250792 RepID=UPI001C04B77E|nr:lymphocyte activation gene 3 protein-like isoform X1 [Melanotaenia boesemani]